MNKDQLLRKLSQLKASIKSMETENKILPNRFPPNWMQYVPILSRMEFLEVEILNQKDELIQILEQLI